MRIILHPLVYPRKSDNVYFNRITVYQYSCKKKQIKFQNKRMLLLNY